MSGADRLRLLGLGLFAGGLGSITDNIVAALMMIFGLVFYVRAERWIRELRE